MNARNWLALGAVVLLATAAHAQMGGYSSMKIDRAGQIVGNFNGAIEEMSGGVSIVLLSDDPAKGNLPIKADRITFEWAEDGGQPRLIVLTGDVRITHPQADIAAEKAEWNFESGELVFTGNPVMNSPKAQDMRGSRMVLNMEAGTFRVEGVSIDTLPLGGMTGGGGSGGGGGMSESEIGDWPGFVNALKGGQAGTPAGHLLSLLDPGARQTLQDTPTDLVVQNKGKLMGQLNKLWAAPQFYNASAWSGVALPEEVKGKLEDPNLEAGERATQNKAAFRAAFAPFMN